jgi:hypothetical protein
MENAQLVDTRPTVFIGMPKIAHTYIRAYNPNRAELLWLECKKTSYRCITSQQQERLTNLPVSSFGGPNVDSAMPVAQTAPSPRHPLLWATLVCRSRVRDGVANDPIT